MSYVRNATRAGDDYVVLEVNSAPGLDNYLYQGRRNTKLPSQSPYLKVLKAACGKNAEPVNQTRSWRLLRVGCGSAVMNAWEDEDRPRIDRRGAAMSPFSHDVSGRPTS